MIEVTQIDDRHVLCALTFDASTDFDRLVWHVRRKVFQLIKAYSDRTRVAFHIVRTSDTTATIKIAFPSVQYMKGGAARFNALRAAIRQAEVSANG